MLSSVYLLQKVSYSMTIKVFCCSGNEINLYFLQNTEQTTAKSSQFHILQPFFINYTHYDMAKSSAVEMYYVSRHLQPKSNAHRYLFSQVLAITQSIFKKYWR